MNKNFTTVYFTDNEIEAVKILVSLDKKHSAEWNKTFESGDSKRGFKFSDEQISRIVKEAHDFFAFPMNFDFMEGPEQDRLQDRLEQLALMQNLQMN